MQQGCIACLIGLVLCSGQVMAGFPHHVKRALLTPEVHDKLAMYSEHHVDYADAVAGRHVALHYQAQQHLDVSTWNLDDIADLSAAVIEDGGCANSAISAYRT